MIQRAQIDALEATFGLPLSFPTDSGGNFSDWTELAAVLIELKQQVLPERPIIAISGSQGSGKSTLASIVTELDPSLHCASLDDFYLGRAERLQLAAEIHPLLATRGVPGTHDHTWLGRLLAAVKSGVSSQHPSFDKGSDDRNGLVDVKAPGLIIEGWCLGVESQALAALEQPCNNLERVQDVDGRWRRWVNDQVATHYTKLWPQVDFWIHLIAPGFAQVQAWRWQQEQALPADQRMTYDEVTRFIQHYQRLTEHLWAQSLPGPGLVIKLDEDHTIADIEPIADI